ncbi:MAG: diguanylate cyclase [Lachnospiraceae bacterium]
MNKQKKDNTNIIQWAIPSLLLVLFLIITLLNYNTSMMDTAREKVISKLRKQVSALCDYYADSLASLTTIAEITADYCSSSEELFAEQNVKLIAEVVDRTDVKKAYIQKKDGTAIDHKGNSYTKIDIKKELSELMDGKTKVTSFFQDEDGEEVLLVAAPIKTDTELLGVTIFVYKPGELAEIVDTPDYLSTNTYALVTDKGKVIECVGDGNGLLAVGDSFFSRVEGAVFLDGSLRILTQNISNQKNGEVEIKKSPDIEKFVIYEPIGKYHSSIVMLVNHNQVERNISDENRSTRSLMNKISISIFAFTLILVGINVINRAKYMNENKELKNKAETDLLTDLLNKVATEKKIKEYLQHEGREKSSIMFVLDIDNFKKINDTMGHAFGDEVLSTLGKQIKAEFRINDIIGRTGGDEFTIFLKDLKDDETMTREAERVARFFKNFKVGEYTKYFATASIGAAVYPRDACDFESLYKAADQALYKAKKRGKNQLAFYKDKEGSAEIKEEDIIDPSKMNKERFPL